MPLVPKEVIAPDEYQTPDGVVKATPARIRHWCRQGQRMRAKGLQIPMPWEHQDDAKPRTPAQKLADQARYNAGFVARFFLDRDGRLWAMLDFPDEKTAEYAKRNVKYVSPEIDPEFTDGDGQVWHDVITHVALTPRPVGHRQSPFGTKPRLGHGSGKPGCIRLSLDQGKNYQSFNRYRRRSIPMADDYTADEQDDDTDPGGPDDDGLVEEIKGLLSQKMGLDLPSHTNKDNFLRDLSVALHAHPGHCGGQDMSDEEQAGREYEQGDRRERGGAREELPTAMMSRRRRGRTLSHGRPGRIAPERGRAVAKEQLANSRIAPRW